MDLQIGSFESTNCSALLLRAISIHLRLAS